MRKIAIVLLGLFSSSSLAQQLTPCDSIYYHSFYNFVNYDDSVGYSLTYRIDSGHEECLSDTIALINFLLSDRFNTENSKRFNPSAGTGLANTELSLLAHRTNHAKIRPLPDSLYTHISDMRTQSIGSGRQIPRLAPREVLKLYFISALYFGDFQFRNEIALMKGEREVSIFYEELVDNEYPEVSFEIKIKNERILNSALKAYDKWLSLLNEKGLESLRSDNIHPLSFSKKVSWRNKSFDPFDGQEIK